MELKYSSGIRFQSCKVSRLQKVRMTIAKGLKLWNSETLKLCNLRLIPHLLLRNHIADLIFRKSFSQPVEPQINYRRRIERQQLAQQQSAYNRDAQRTPQFRPCPRTQRQRQAAQ